MAIRNGQRPTFNYFLFGDLCFSPSINSICFETNFCFYKKNSKPIILKNNMYEIYVWIIVAKFRFDFVRFETLIENLLVSRI